MHSDGAIRFSHPTFGITTPDDGHIAKQERPTHVYRVGPVTGAAGIAVETIRSPNGIFFSPDETQLYVSENGITPRAIWRYDVGRCRLDHQNQRFR